MKKIQPNNNIASKFLNGIVTKVNAIIDKLIVDVKVNGTSVVTVNEDGEREADIDLSVSDQNVKQSPTTDNADYRILLSKSANDTEETDISRKNTNFKYNPSTGNLQVSKVNGNTVPSGSGNDTLAKTSDIPTVNNGKLTINQNSTLKGEFTANNSGNVTVDLTDTTYESKAEASGGTDVSLVTTGEKYTWNTNRAVSEIRLTNEDLDNVTTPGFYFAAGGNTVTNKPTGYNNFGLVVIHNASGSQYTQIISNENGSYRRIKKANGTWTSWAEDKFTDENVKQAILEQTDTGWHKVIIGGTSLSETTDKVNIVNGLNYRPSTGTFSVDSADGVANTARTNIVKIGNNKTKATANHVEGRIDLYGENGGYSTLKFDTSSISHRTHTLPDKDGTLATTEDAVMWTQHNILGAKNLITFPYYHGFNRTFNNVVFTVDNQGIITVGGTQASANTSFWLMYDVVLPNGTYTLSDGGVGTADTYLSLLYYTGGSSTTNYIDVGTSGSVTFTAENWDRIRLRIWSRNGKTANNLVFKPMLRLASIIDDTWKPYAETNYNLTVGKLNSNNVATIESTDTASKAYAVGDYMVWRSQLYRVTTAIASGGTITNDTNVVTTTVGAELKRIVNLTWNYVSNSVTKTAWVNVCADSAIELQIYFDSTAVLGAYNYTNSIFIPVNTIPTSGTNTYSVFYFKTTSSNAYISFDLKRENGYVKMKLYEVYSNGSSYSGSGTVYFNCYYR